MKRASDRATVLTDLLVEFRKKHPAKSTGQYRSDKLRVSHTSMHSAADGLFQHLDGAAFGLTPPNATLESLGQVIADLYIGLGFGFPKSAVVAPRAEPEQSSVAARFRALSGEPIAADRATEAPRGKGWAVLAEGLGVPVETLTQHPIVRRSIALAAASNGQPSILSEVEAKMLLRELDESTKTLARLRPIREVALPESVQGVRVGPFAHQIVVGDFEGTVRVGSVTNGVVRRDETRNEIETSKTGPGADVQRLVHPAYAGEETQLTFEPREGTAFTVRIPRGDFSVGNGSAGYRTLKGFPRATAYVHE